MNITIEETYHFLGVILKKSIDNCNMGGYKAYFEPPKHLYLSSTYHLKLGHFDPWALKVFTLQCFKQIRAAYHPEVGSSSINDKYHQPHYIINCINKAAKKCFVPGRKLSFDEGGIASCSRHCPVRQYNKDKPDKFRVEFFCLANCDNKRYFIYHADIYQGRNIANIDIPQQRSSASFLTLLLTECPEP